jgi:hypothetical protein
MHDQEHLVKRAIQYISSPLLQQTTIMLNKVGEAKISFLYMYF